MSSDTLIFNLTVGQLQEVIRDVVNNTIEERLSDRMPKVTEKGIDGLARIIGTSKTHAQRLKSKGIFRDAIVQVGRSISIDVVKAQQIWSNIQKEQL